MNCIYSPWSHKEWNMTERLSKSRHHFLDTIFTLSKVGLKLNIQQDHGIWSHTSWEIDGETVETLSDYFWGLQSHWRW